MRWPIVLGFLLAFFMFLAVSVKSFSKLQKSTPTPIPFNEEKLFNLIQDWRRSENLQAYIKDERLCEIARDRADDEPVLDNHQGFIDKYWTYPYKLQENLSGIPNSSYNGNIEKDIMLSWLNSKPHRVTLEKPYIHSCVVCDKQCVQIFSSFEK